MDRLVIGAITDNSPNSLHKVVIADETFGNVGNIKTEIVREYYYQLTTLNGHYYEKLRYEVKNHTIVFFNLLDGVYDHLKSIIKLYEGADLPCGIPKTDGGFDYAYYRVSITDEINKGYHNGKYYRNGLTVYFKAVLPDE